MGTAVWQGLLRNGQNQGVPTDCIWWLKRFDRARNMLGFSNSPFLLEAREDSAWPDQLASPSLDFQDHVSEQARRLPFLYALESSPRASASAIVGGNASVLTMR